MLKRLFTITLFSSLCLCCYSPLLHAQIPVKFQHLGIEDGLSQSSVFAITQDGDGFMWFGTRDGLNRYDGYRFVTYRTEAGVPNSLASNDVRHLYYDPVIQQLWVGTSGGLSCYSPAQDTFANYYQAEAGQPGLAANPVHCLLRDTNGHLWVATEGGLNLWDDSIRNFRTIEPGPAFSASPPDIRTISQDAAGRLWIGTTTGLYALRNTGPSSFRLVPAAEISPALAAVSGLYIGTLQVDNEANLWIGTHSEGVFCLDSLGQNIQAYPQVEPGLLPGSASKIRSMTLDKSGNLWVGTFAGLSRRSVSGGVFQSIDSDDFGTGGGGTGSTQSAFTDIKGGIWVGTFYGGVYYFSEKASVFKTFRHHPAQNSLSGNIISSFAEDEQENLWIGTEGGGLNYYDRRENRFTAFQFDTQRPNSLSGDNVKTLLYDDGKVWVGTFQYGLNLLNPRTGVFQHFRHQPDNPQSLSKNNVYGLLRKDRYLWVATYGGGLNKMEVSTQSFTHFRHDPDDSLSISSDNVRGIFQDKAGDLWIGTENGINLMQVDLEGTVYFRRYLSDVAVYVIQQAAGDKLWIGTLGQGLFHFEKASGKWTRYTMQDGLPGNTIFGILTDALGNVWLSTNQGISRLNPNQGTFVNYNDSDGLENVEFIFNGYYKTRSGEFLFGGIKGFTLFRPTELRPNTYIPPVVFTGLEVLNKEVKVGDTDGLLTKALNRTSELTLGYHSASITIRFAALDYTSPKGNHFAYYMEGIDQNWNYVTGQSSATYTIQREGTYRFRLRGANKDGIWNPAERQLVIRVLPPIWRTTWAYLLYAVVLVLLLVAVVRFIKLRQAFQLEQIAKQQQEDLHQIKLSFFTNITHEFRTPLTLILGPIHEMIHTQNDLQTLKKQLVPIEQNAQRLLNLVNQLIYFRKQESEHLKLEVAPGNIVLFLREIYLSFQENARLQRLHYTFHSSTEEIKVWYDRDKLEKVIFNLLSNAMKFTKVGGTVSLRVSADATAVIIEVQDNGCGISPELHEEIFKRFYEKGPESGYTQFKGSGIGLAYSRQLVELHQGSIAVSSRLGEGAIFTVRLPLGRSHLKVSDMLSDFRSSDDLTRYPPLPATARTEPTEATATDQPHVLIIEDNPEVNAYIRTLLAETYRVSTAFDGRQGLEMAHRLLPDLIVSDVMMPELDGISLCNQLKTQLETSHIPIILLTARTGLIFRIEGLETGADDYLTKPFHPDELKLKIRNTLEARRKLWENFARLRDFEPTELKLSSPDDRFLEKLMQTVEKHIENPDFSIEQFAEELAVSRPLLFTKIKALTNQTPNNFLKTIRLKRAAQLLQLNQMNISEIAYQVGFRDARYFSKCFQKEYGQTPTEFASQHRK